MKNIFAFIFVALILFSSCEDYLDEKQSKSADQEIETVEDIELLLNNTVDLLGNTQISADVNFVPLTDDCGYISDVYAAFGRWIDFSVVQNYTWQDKIDAVDDESWTKAYKDIWTANYIINEVDGLAGSEGQSEESLAAQKANLKAEGHLIKAYKMLALAMKHCLYPSNANASELGLPLKNTNAFDDLPARASLEETFIDIEEHIIEGLKITKDRGFSWRDNKGSAAALAARFYIYIHDFDNAKKYAEQALANYDHMVNMENDVQVLDVGGYPVASTSNYGIWYDDLFDDVWQTQYKIHYVDDYNLYPNAELMASYDPTDLRKVFFSNQYLDYWYGIPEGYKYEKFSGLVLTGTDVAEMYLILAECAARTGDYPVYMQNIEMIRVNRFNTADYSPLPTPTSINEAIQLVIDERRKELVFSSSRWSDIKRLNAEGLLDPITLKRDFYRMAEGVADLSTPQIYTLEPNSRGYARPLPNEVVTLTDGKVEQNTY